MDFSVCLVSSRPCHRMEASSQAGGLESGIGEVENLPVVVTFPEDRLLEV